jgi:hypothetical protein
MAVSPCEIWPCPPAETVETATPVFRDLSRNSRLLQFGDLTDSSPCGNFERNAYVGRRRSWRRAPPPEPGVRSYPKVGISCAISFFVRVGRLNVRLLSNSDWLNLKVNCWVSRWRGRSQTKKGQPDYLSNQLEPQPPTLWLPGVWGRWSGWSFTPTTVQISIF